MLLKDKKIAVYVTGGIAVYKVIDLVREFIKRGAEVQVAMTQSACEFVSPLTFQILSKNIVYTDLFEGVGEDSVSHIHLADWADLSVVAPATANMMAKMANGIADDFVSTSLLAVSSPVTIIPAMNTNMWRNPATKRNKQLLEERGYMVMQPDTGFLAEGYEGEGRFPQKEAIIEEIESFVRSKGKGPLLQNKKVLVTAGGTKEKIDPVRYITNASSGKMGHAIAQAAKEQGAEVTLVTASSLPVSRAIQTIPVESASEMREAVLEHYEESDLVVMAAAVSDFQPMETSMKKIKKSEETMSLKLTKTPDILKELGKRKKNQVLVGFAAETHNVSEYAKGKLQEKNLDLIVANDVSQPDAGFNVDTNEVILFNKTGDEQHFSTATKTEIAEQLIQYISKEMLVE